MRSTVRLALVALLSLPIGLASCGKDSNKGTNPPPGGTELNSGTIGLNQVFQHTFATAGTFNYQCTIHPQMVGTVTVNAGSANDSAFVDIVNNTATGFQPGAVTIKPGGHVRWFNSSSMNHNVTSH